MKSRPALGYFLRCGNCGEERFVEFSDLDDNVSLKEVVEEMLVFLAKPSANEEAYCSLRCAMLDGAPWATGKERDPNA